jgi:hypothetical protein
MAAASSTRPDLHRGPTLAGLGRRRLPAPDGPRRRQALGEADRIVDDEGHVAIGADPLKRLGQTRRAMLVDVLDGNWKAATGPASSARARRSGKAPVTSSGEIR